MSDSDLEFKANLKETVKILIPKDEEHLFDSLQQYQSSLDLLKFVADLKTVINEPEKICLFDEIRPLIPLNQQIAYDSLCPIIPSATRKVVHLQNNENECLGFSLRGGAEHGTGTYITKISPTSEAYKKGLRCGDEIVSINGFHISKAIHGEIIDLINDLQEIELKIKRVGMIPFRIKASDVVRWQYVPKENIISDPSNYPLKIFINMSTTGGLGCRIVSGPPNQKGIFVQFVKPDSLAQEAGLERGDQILSVNETSFLDVTHSQAVMALKTSQHLLLRVRKSIATTWIDNLRTSSKSTGENELNISTLTLSQKSSVRSDYSQLQSSYGLTGSKTAEPLYSVPMKSESKNEGQQLGEIDVEIINGFHNDNQSPYNLDNDSASFFAEPPPDFLVDSNSHDNDPPVDSNFTLYKNPELSVSNENVDTLSENEARKLFTEAEIGGRQIRTIKICINGPLGLALEGGANSPLEGRILVSNIYTGCVYHQGGIHVRDEILMADNVKLIGSTLLEAESVLNRAERKSQKSIEFVIAVASPMSYQEEVTYF